MASESYLLRPDPNDPALTREVTGVDEAGRPVTTRVTVERALTLYLNSREIVTMMTILDHPAELAVGYLLNQAMTERVHVFELPFKTRTITVSQMWHPRMERDPAHRWLREKVLEVCRAVC